MQLTFGDAEDLGQRKRTRREVFLGEMEHVVPWNALLALIAPHYLKLGRPGRQPYLLETMLRIHFLQQWYALSDPAMEETIYDTPVMRRFARLGGLDGVPDETTILNFRRLLETHGLASKLLGAKVEHPFRVVKRQFGYTKVRCRGLVKNTAQVLTLFALSKLWMARRQLLPASGAVRL